MYVGLDLGTSSVKAVLIDELQQVVGSAGVELSVARPYDGWSEQDPESWWQAALEAVDSLKAHHPKQMAGLKAIGLSGQMHGATLLGSDDRPLRPCMLWNDVRAAKQCAELQRAEPAFNARGGNLVMPGFTAPKVQWVREREPDVFAAISKVLLPKDYIRLKLTGDHASDMSDSSGTLWLDVARRDWDDALLAATGLDRSHMPRLVEGTEISGTLLPGLCRRWGISGTPVIAGGAGDNAAAACGIGAVTPGSAFMSLGTSGVLFATNDRFSPNIADGVHAMCHALPGTWHQMGVILSATDSLNWLADVLKMSPAGLTGSLRDVEAPADVLFLPYLGGERTPHNDADIRGAFCGLSHNSDEAGLTHAVLDGVAFALRDCKRALEVGGTSIDRLTVVGGGSNSGIWLKIIANVLKCPVELPEDGSIGAAMGAARLGQVAAGQSVSRVFAAPNVLKVIEPEPELAEAYEAAYQRWLRFYPAVKSIY
ncbi:xylulokinase [Roseibium sp. RKSG952]|uniref:xylulokinase n=1 Tax=Roseibium sp. RKSG952 TaxID=2529384 RepID=UPI0012BBAB47|nr:xylulokinase [Roseibium sp. RKSG952]MTH96216.1 xylulokinase [Roseibium sp. RKSG952]